MRNCSVTTATKPREAVSIAVARTHLTSSAICPDAIGKLSTLNGFSLIQLWSRANVMPERMKCLW